MKRTERRFIVWDYPCPTDPCYVRHFARDNEDQEHHREGTWIAGAWRKKRLLLRPVLVVAVATLLTSPQRSNGEQSPQSNAAERSQSDTYTTPSGVRVRSVLVHAAEYYPPWRPAPYALSALDKNVADYASALLTDQMLKLDAATWRYYAGKPLVIRPGVTTPLDLMPLDEAKGLYCELMRRGLEEADRLNGVEWKGAIAFRVEALRTYDPRSKTWSEWNTLKARFAFVELEKRRNTWKTGWGGFSPLEEASHVGGPEAITKPPAALTQPGGPAVTSVGPGESQQQTERDRCWSQMKQIGLAARFWARDHQDVFPANFLEMSAKLENPGLLVCPSDKGKRPMTTWADFDPKNISYEYNPKADPGKVLTILTICRIHMLVGFSDGSVQLHTADSLGRAMESAWRAGGGGDFAKPPTTPTADPSAVTIESVCPNGQLGEFHHGTKCTGYYGEKGLVDIQVAGKDTSKEYVSTKSLVHAGVDLGAPEGADVFPIADGAVDDVISSEKDASFGKLGYMVLVEHKNKLNGKRAYSIYLHLKEKPSVAVGGAVVGGKTLLGKVGASGAAFGPHLHLEVRHFAGRLSPQWKNIYGVERPSSEATFDEKDFAESWADPEKLSSRGQSPAAAAAPAQEKPANADQAQTALATLDPALLIKDCVNIHTSEQGNSSAIRNTDVFNRLYKNKRVQYTGVVDSVKKPAGPVTFARGGDWPMNWRVEAHIPQGTQGLLDPLQKGQQLTVEGEISELKMPIPDVKGGILGTSSRTIRLQNTRIVQQ